MSMTTDAREDVKEQQQPMLTISIASGETPEANVPLVWCINKAMLEHLTANGAANPYILISVCSVSASGQRTETMRYVEPIKLGVKHVSFSRPGKSEVRAAVVWDYGDDIKRLKNILLSKSVGGYHNDILDYYKENFSIEGSEVGVVPSYKTIQVNVPAEMFAKEPPKWLQQYIQKFVRGKAFDECHFRKRAIPSLLSMPFVLPVVMVFRLLAVIVMSVLGMVRGLNLKPLWHPFSMTTGEIWGGVDKDDGPIWVTKKAKDRWGDTTYVGRKFPFWIINPPVILLASLVLFIVSSWHVTRDERVEPNLGWSYLKCLAVSALGAVALVALVALLIGLFIVVTTAGAWAIDRLMPSKYKDDDRSFRQRRADSKKAKRKAAIQQARAHAPTLLTPLAGMVCGDGPKPTNPQRSVKENVMLWVDGEKHKRCKPFAR